MSGLPRPVRNARDWAARAGIIPWYAKGQAGGEWSPLDIPGLLAWLDAPRQAAALNLSPEDTTQPDTLTDFSGNERHAENQGALKVTLKRTNGRWVFDIPSGAAYNMPAGTIPTGNSNYGIVAVASRTQVSSSVVTTLINTGASETNKRVTLKVHTSFRLNTAWFNNNLFSAENVITPGKTHTLETYFDGAGRTQFVDGEAAGSDSETAKNTTSAAVQLFRESGSSQWEGVMESLLFFDGPLSADDRSRLLAYLAEARGPEEGAQALATFGFVTDLHYSSVTETYSNRYCQDGDEKLTDAVIALNEAEVDFIVFGGDLIDTDDGTQALTDLATIEDVFGDATAPRHYVLGNHDMASLSKAEFLGGIGGELQVPDPYYSFDVNGVHFVILDACYDADDDDAGYDSGDFNFQNSYVNPTQRSWLESDLAGTELPTIVFCHQRLDEDGGELRVDNRAAVRSILEASGVVLGVFCGHAHTNAKNTINGIDYYVMQAATEGAYPTNAYAVVRVYPSGKVTVEGFGGQASY